MRFLCEQCKAKYQIADEKVAGKTVRMKCRKCGHLIEVKAEVTETSVASQAPQAPQARPNDDGDDATRVGMDVNAMMKLSAMTAAARDAAAPTRPQAPPRPGAPPAPPPRPALATSLASAKPARPASLRPDSALAGAFQKSVQREDDLGLLEISTSSEWYVAINGVPVGPVRIAELRRKAHTGAVTEQSLVWQEGMEEWRPLKTVTELLAIVQEGMSSDRPSLVTPEPPRHAPPRRAGSAQPHPAKPTTLPRSNVVSLASRLATAEKLEPEPFAAAARDPFAVPSSHERPSGIDPFAPAATSAPLATAASAPLASPLAAAAPTVITEIPARRPGPNWIVLGMVVAFGAFGVTAGIAVFFNKAPPPQPAPTIVLTTGVPPTVAGGTVVNAGDNTNPAPSSSDRPTIATNGNPGVRNTGTGVAAATTSTGKVVDPSIAALLGGPGTGPAIGGGSGGSGGGSALSQDAIEKVVQQRSAGVKRTCWERGGGTESNVNVRVHLTIAASGGVQSASAEGNDPIVSKCIESSVHGWSFPPSSGPTTVDIPFHFLRQ